MTQLLIEHVQPSVKAEQGELFKRQYVSIFTCWTFTEDSLG